MKCLALLFAICFVFPSLAFSEEDGPEAMEPGGRVFGFGSVLEGVKDVLEAIEKEGAEVVEAPPVGVPIVLSARRAVEMALMKNPQVFGAEAEVRSARARQGQAKSGFLPQIKIGTTYTFQEGAEETFGDNFFTDLVAPGGSGIKEIVRADTFEVEQVLWSGGRLMAAYRASKFLTESESWRRSATLDQIEFLSKQSYYDSVLAIALVQVAEDSVKTFERHYTDAKQMYDVGLTSRFEVLRAETELGSRQADLVEARNRVRLAKTVLRRLLSIPQDREISIAGRIDWIPIEGTPAELVATATKNRPEVKALNSALAAAKQEVRRLKHQYYPTAGARARWSNLVNAGGFSVEGWNVSLGAQWDLFLGGRRKHALLEGEANFASLQHQLEDLKLVVEFDVRQAYIQVQDAVAKIRREDGNVELAREGQRLAALRFQEGVGTQADVLDAELALTNAETQLVVALREYAVAHASLDKALGRSWVDRGALGLHAEGL